MDTKKLSLAITLATSTAVLLAGAVTLGGITHHYTNGFSLDSLKIRCDFNNFLKSEQAESEQKNCPDYLRAVSDFVMHNGKGTLIAKQEPLSEYFTFEYFKENNEPNDYISNKTKIKTLKNWSAVAQYLKDVERFKKQPNAIDTEHEELKKQNRIAEKNLREAKQNLADMEKLYNSKGLPDFYNSEAQQQLEEQERRQIEEKQNEYRRAQQDWVSASSFPPNLNSGDCLKKITKSKRRSGNESFY